MVGKICTVCKNYSYSDKKLSFFTYPGDEKRRFQWLQAVNRLDLMKKLENDRTRGNHRICEAHFEDKFVKKSTTCEGRKFLTKDAYPTLHLEKIVKTPEIMLKQTSLQAMNTKEYSTEEEYETEDESESSSLPCTDIADFCESVIKVSRTTQTVLGNNNSKFVRYSDNIVKQTNNEFYQNGITKESFLQSCRQFLPDHMTQIIKWNLYKRNDCSLNLFALNLYFSGNSYNILKDMLGLPSVETLKKFLVPKNTQLSAQFLNALKSKVNNMSADERICSISVGCLLLKPHLYYDIQFDRIVGFHDMDGEQITKPAKYAVVLMLRGMLENWTQPVAYTFISEYDNFPEISLWIDEVIVTLISIGLDIKAFIADPRSEFLYISESRLVTTDQPYFTINGKNIYYMYDTARLLRILKNNLKSCDFHYNGKVADTGGTMDFFKNLDKLLSLLNSKKQMSNLQFNRAFCNEKYQVEFMNKMLDIFKHLKVIRKADGVDVTENMKFVECFQITIKSVLQLFNELVLLGATHLLTCRLTLSCIDRFFNRIKRKSVKEECTPIQFNRCFKRSLVHNLMKKPIKYNSEPSSGDDFKQEALEMQFIDTANDLNQPLAVGTIDYRVGLPVKNVFVYVCSFCYHKCIQRHSCDELTNYLDDIENSEEKSDLTYLCSLSLGLSIKNRKILPPDSFIQFIMLLENKFKDYFKPDIQINSVAQEIYKEMEDCEFDMPCQCFPVDYLKALFIRVRIFYMIRKNNRSFKKKGIKLFRLYDL